MWDAQHKKRISQMPGYETSIAALAFSRCLSRVVAMRDASARVLTCALQLLARRSCSGSSACWRLCCLHTPARSAEWQG